MTRRTLLASTLAAGCGRQLAHRYFGWLFIASAAEKALAIADLSQFRRVTSVSLPQAPSQVLRVGRKIFVVCPDGRALYEVDLRNFTVAGKIGLPGRVMGAAVCPNSATIAVIVDQPASLHLVDPSTRRVTRRTPLPETPSGIDVTNTVAAVTTSRKSLIRVSLRDGTVPGTTDLGLHAGIVRMHPVPDPKLVLIGAADSNEIVTVNVESGALLARLPLAFIPQRFCFKSDGGQMFVTGTSGDMIAIVNPYQSEVDQTMVGGRTPYGLAAGFANSQELLFVTNPESGDLTIFDIETRKKASSVHVGGKPGEVLLTPNGEYALIVDQQTGDVAVVHIKTVVDPKVNTAYAPLAKPLFTIFPTGPAPQSAAILPQEG